MDWHLFKADKTRLKWSIRGTLFNGDDVKIPGHRDKKIALEMLRNVERLNRAKANNDHPSQEVLPWLDNQPEGFVKVLIAHRLVDRRRLDCKLPLYTFLAEYEEYLATRKRKGHSPMPKRNTEKIRRILNESAKIRTFEDISVDAVTGAVLSMKACSGNRQGQALSDKSKREYYCAFKCFCKWMRRERKFTHSPLEDLKLPSAKKNRVRNRHPLFEHEYDKLIGYLHTAGPYEFRDFSWSSYDRAMLYWAAVTTGCRLQELLSLTPANFNFEVSPSELTVYGDDSKNGCTATVPIRDDFAHAIKEHTKSQLPTTSVFRVPKTAGQLRQAFFHDLDAAGIERKRPNGEVVDFHALRSTAICWWLRAGLDLVEVKTLARLETLELVQQYARRYVPEYRALVGRTAKVANPFQMRMQSDRNGAQAGREGAQ